MRAGAAWLGGLLVLVLASAGCQTFVDVATVGDAPVFTWRADAPVTGLTVVADEDCELPGGAKAYGDRIWWRIEGRLSPPVTFGKVPQGAVESVPARPLLRSCHWWSVTLTDQTMQGESTKFRW